MELSISQDAEAAYTPLDVERGEIRLLHLAPGARGSDPVGRLSHTSLIEPEVLPYVNEGCRASMNRTRYILTAA